MAATPEDTTDQLPLPRDPSAYRACDHFRYRFTRRDDPPITGEVIETCIREGVIHEAREPRRYRFEAHINGIRWWLVVDRNAREPHTVVTAFAPEIHDPSTEERPPV
jgi:hypothetical protein